MVWPPFSNLPKFLALFYCSLRQFIFLQIFQLRSALSSVFLSVIYGESFPIHFTVLWFLSTYPANDLRNFICCASISFCLHLSCRISHPNSRAGFAVFSCQIFTESALTWRLWSTVL
jgi:hypothetical protein